MRRARCSQALPNIVTPRKIKVNLRSWPEGEPGEDSFRFCGKLAVPGKPYCEAHCKIAYVPPKKRQSAAATEIDIKELVNNFS